VTQIVVTLVFSIVMLLFMAWPAKLITDAVARKKPLKEHLYNTVLIGIDILLSLGVGLFLRFA